MKDFFYGVRDGLAVWAPFFLLALFVFAVADNVGRSTYAAENIVVDRVVISGAAAGGTTGALGAEMTRCRETAAYVVWSAGSSAGVVTIESAHDATYTGTWASLATVTFAAASKVDIAQITGIHRALRARISTTVTGGTVIVRFVCN